MPDPISITISVFSLIVSAITAWLTFFRRGTVKMSRPTAIYFGPDSPRAGGKEALSKIYVRSLLFSNSKRGRVIESMYVTLARGEIRQNFNIWVYGEREKIVRGSGLFVPETGTSLNHHFLTPMDEDTFNFKEGTYKIEVFANVLGNKEKSLLFSQELFITQSHAEELKDKNSGIYFDWSPATQSYFAHIERRPPSPDAENFLRFLSEMRNPEKSASSDVP